MLANRVREFTSTSGTGDIALGGAMPGHIGFLDAFAEGDSVSYVIEDGDNYEIGEGTLAPGGMLERTTVFETLESGVYANVGAVPITLSGNARLYCAATARHLTSTTFDADLIREVTPGGGITLEGNLTLENGDARWADGNHIDLDTWRLVNDAGQTYSGFWNSDLNQWAVRVDTSGTDTLARLYHGNTLQLETTPAGISVPVAASFAGILSAPHLSLF